MRKNILTICILALLGVHALAQDTLWVKYDNRFKENKPFAVATYDSLEFRANKNNFSDPVVRFYSNKFGAGFMDYKLSLIFGNEGFQNGSLMLRDPGRIIWKPSYYSDIDYMNDKSRWCFKHSMESEHFIVFWEKGFGDDPTRASNTYHFYPTALLARAENYWNKYVNDLGFLIPGQSTTDKYKIEMYVFFQNDWKAEGSGVDAKCGLLNVSPGAISARGGHTVAHEVGHTFQYLVSCDLGQNHGYNYGYGDNASGGNGWWESCANWQAYKCYPERQFTDGEYFEGHLGKHHLNILHEDWRYENCFIQDYWCMKHGQDFIGRLWRESNKPEDPMETYRRLNGFTQAQLNDDMYEGFARMATWDIDGVRDAAKHRIGQHISHLRQTEANDGTWQIEPAYCIQNYGYTIVNMNPATAGTEVKAHFKGIAGAAGYRSIHPERAGWRYGFVAYSNDGTRTYGEMGRDKEGIASLTIPEQCDRLFFVVMGAPTEYWRHPWDDNESNDEQWPFQVKFDNTDVYGHFGEYPANYVRRDTTVYIDAELLYDGSSYTSTRVQYDMAAVSQALGVSTQQMKNVGRTASSNPRFVGVSANGQITTGTTTSTSSNTCYGHWFDQNGNVCNYDSSARIYAEFYPDSYGCYVGQYPGRLTRGNTYTVRQAIQYTIDGKQYTATMVVNLKVK